MKVGVAQDRFDLGKVSPGRRHQAPQTHVGPDYGGIRVPLKNGIHLAKVGRFGFVLCYVLCNGDIDIVVQYDHQTNLRGKIENAIKRRVLQACNFAGNLR